MALFYHYSNVKCETLEPRIGGHRHAGEDSKAVNEAVVWLNNKELDCFEDQNGVVKFLHIVEVDVTDPNLYLENGFRAFMESFENEFQQNNGAPLRWYFYKGQLPVKQVRQWDGERYV